MKFLIWLVPLAVTLGCASGHCRKQTQLPPPPPEEETEAKPVGSDQGRIFVYKPDGSRQCDAGTGVSLEKMQRELNKIKVFSSRKQREGGMRPALCGAATGMANIYEISAKDLPAAEKANFKKWSY